LDELWKNVVVELSSKRHIIEIKNRITTSVLLISKSKLLARNIFEKKKKNIIPPVALKTVVFLFLSIPYVPKVGVKHSIRINMSFNRDTTKLIYALGPNRKNVERSNMIKTTGISNPINVLVRFCIKLR